MSPRVTAATAARVLRQLRHDPRTVALIVVLPCVLLGLLAWMFDGTDVLDEFGPVLVALFPMVVMFLVTSVATLRERQSGTLERLMSMPVGKADFVAGYALAFGLVAVVQAVVVTGLTVWGYGMDVEGTLWLLMLVAVLDALLGTALGLGMSALATTEFQAVQLMPVTLFPQLLLCGIIMPRDQMPDVLGWISRVLPLTYAIEAVTDVATGSGWSDVRGAVGVLVLFIVGALALGVLTLRRRTP